MRNNFSGLTTPHPHVHGGEGEALPTAFQSRRVIRPHKLTSMSMQELGSGTVV